MEISRYKKLFLILLGVLLLAIVLGSLIQEVRSSILERDMDPFSRQIAARQTLVEQYRQTRAPELTEIAKRPKPSGIIGDDSEGPVQQSPYLP